MNAQQESKLLRDQTQNAVDDAVADVIESKVAAFKVTLTSSVLIGAALGMAGWLLASALFMVPEVAGWKEQSAPTWASVGVRAVISILLMGVFISGVRRIRKRLDELFPSGKGDLK